MRILRILVPLIFVAVLGVSIYYRVVTVEDLTLPVIRCEAETVEASVDSTDAELLRYVTAYDEKDGDISSSVVVESISAFIKPGEAQITYAVCDSDYNVSRITKPLVYSDYHPPKFISSSDLVFPVSTSVVRFLDYVTAQDSLDGDLTGRLTVINSAFVGSEPGTYPVTFRASNLHGDISEITLNIVVVEKTYSSSAYEIELENHIVYTQIGKTPDFRGYILSVNNKRASGEDAIVYSADDVEIDLNGYNPKKPGVYEITYTLYDAESEDGGVLVSTRLFAVCEGAEK